MQGEKMGGATAGSRNAASAADGRLRAAATAAEAAALRRGLRDRLCAGKPGGPGDYRVRLSATCVATAGAGKAAAVAKATAAKKARARKAAGSGAPQPSAAATRAEIAVLRREISTSYPDPTARYDMPVLQGDMLSASMVLLRDMMSPAMRLARPDPLERYNALAAAWRRGVNRPDFDVAALQRFTIMHATQAHLEALAEGAQSGVQSKKARGARR
jgi:hypothetical protein